MYNRLCIRHEPTKSTTIAVLSTCRPSGAACWLWFVCQWSCCHWTQTHSRRQMTLRHVARPRWRKSSIWWRRLRQTFSRTSRRSETRWQAWRDSWQTSGLPVRSQQLSTRSTTARNPRTVRLVLIIVKRSTEYHVNEIGSLTLATRLSAAVEQLTLWRSPLNCSRLGLPTSYSSLYCSGEERVLVFSSGCRNMLVYEPILVLILNHNRSIIDRIGAELSL